MSLQATLEQCLNQFPTLAAGTNTHLCSVDTGTGALKVELTAVDSIGCSFLSMTISSDRLGNRTIDQLKSIGESLALRLNYLMEPVRPLEIDRDACIVQLRSSPPQKDDDGTSYYELLVQQRQISLHRYQKQPASPRRHIPANVTREILHRLATDLVQSVPAK